MSVSGPFVTDIFITCLAQPKYDQYVICSLEIYVVRSFPMHCAWYYKRTVALRYGIDDMCLLEPFSLINCLRNKWI